MVHPWQDDRPAAGGRRRPRRSPRSVVALLPALLLVLAAVVTGAPGAGAQSDENPFDGGAERVTLASASSGRAIRCPPWP